MKEHDFDGALERIKELEYCPEYEAIRHALTLAKKMQDDGNPPSPDKIVIDRDKLEEMRKTVPESINNLNFYDFENAIVWNDCLDAIVAAQQDVDKTQND